STLNPADVRPVLLFPLVSVLIAPPRHSTLFPSTALFRARSGGCGVAVTVVGSLAVLFAAFTSPPPLTVAVFVTLAAALAATLTVTVKEDDLTLATSRSLMVQACGETQQLQLELPRAGAVR